MSCFATGEFQLSDFFPKPLHKSSIGQYTNKNGSLTGREPLQEEKITPPNYVLGMANWTAHTHSSEAIYKNRLFVERALWITSASTSTRITACKKYFSALWHPS